ncbi:MAG: hypothetical protein WBX25_15090 [Rhodomicrobium sp.]
MKLSRRVPFLPHRDLKRKGGMHYEAHTPNSPLSIFTAGNLPLAPTHFWSVARSLAFVSMADITEAMAGG